MKVAKNQEVNFHKVAYACSLLSYVSIQGSDFSPSKRNSIQGEATGSSYDSAILTDNVKTDLT